MKTHHSKRLKMDASKNHLSLPADEEYQFDGADNFFHNGDTFHLPYSALRLYYWMDGINTDERIIKKYNHYFTPSVTAADLKRFVRNLNKKNLLLGRVNGCLVGKMSPYYRKLKRAQFDNEAVRRPFYAGICYEKNPKKLRAGLKTYFDAVNTRRLSALCKGLGRIRGMAVPHSNMEFSGACAAWAYKALSRLPMPDTFVILGPNHHYNIHNLAPYSVVLKDFLTPLGVVEADVDFGKRLAANCKYDIFEERLSHLYEHSIEIQLPFLQHIYKDQKKKVRFIPILCGVKVSSSVQDRFVRALLKTCRDAGKSIFVIASVDLMHEEWGKDPYDFHVSNKNLLHYIARGDAVAFNRHVTLDRYALCGKTPISLLLKILAPCRGKILSYSWTSKSKVFHQSKERIKYDQSTDIGYASVVFH